MYWRLVDRAAATLIKNQILYSALHYVFMIAGVVGFMGVCFSLLAFLEYGFSVSALIALIVCIALSVATLFFENVEKAIIRVQITVIGEEALNEFIETHDISPEMQKEWFSVSQPPRTQWKRLLERIRKAL